MERHVTLCAAYQSCASTAEKAYRLKLCSSCPVTVRGEGSEGILTFFFLRCSCMTALTACRNLSLGVVRIPSMMPRRMCWAILKEQSSYKLVCSAASAEI
jgi:hypothetical protein